VDDLANHVRELILDDCLKVAADIAKKLARTNHPFMQYQDSELIALPAFPSVAGYLSLDDC